MMASKPGPGSPFDHTSTNRRLGGPALARAFTRLGFPIFDDGQRAPLNDPLNTLRNTGIALGADPLKRPSRAGLGDSITTAHHLRASAFHQIRRIDAMPVLGFQRHLFREAARFPIEHPLRRDVQQRSDFRLGRATRYEFLFSRDLVEPLHVRVNFLSFHSWILTHINRVLIHTMLI